MKRVLFFGAVLLCAVLFFYTLHLVFLGTAMDRQLLYNQKIFYYHVPLWFVLFIAVFVCGIWSVLFLKKRDGRYDDVAQAAGELAVLFGLVGLATGSIWARAAWETWWQWDARLTTSLLLWLLMIGYVIVRRFGGPGSDRLSAGLAVFGMVNVPLVYFSVKIWRTMHPETSTKSTLEGSMRSAFWLSVLVFIIFYVLLMIVRVNQLRGERRLRETYERGLDAGLFD